LPVDCGVISGDMTVAADLPQVAGAQRVFQSACQTTHVCDGHGGPFGNLCHDYTHCTYWVTSELTFTSLYKSSGSAPFPYDTYAQPALESDGRDVLMAWFDGPQATGGTVLAARVGPPSFGFQGAFQEPLTLGAFGLDDGQTRPDIATDGERFVVVWRTVTEGGGHDILGASIDGAGKVIPFSVATSSADERDPAIVMVGKGVFLVAYETFPANTRRIAGRFVTFGPAGTRPHAVR
jgi:hypothetical protein